MPDPVPGTWARVLAAIFFACVWLVVCATLIYVWWEWEPARKIGLTAVLVGVLSFAALRATDTQKGEAK